MTICMYAGKVWDGVGVVEITSIFLIFLYLVRIYIVLEVSFESILFSFSNGFNNSLRVSPFL
jgi:hypothetical protein